MTDPVTPPAVAGDGGDGGGGHGGGGHGDGWEKLSPLSLILRGGIMLLAVVGWFGTQLVNRLSEAVGGQWDGGPRPDPGDRDEVDGILAHPFIAVGILLGVLALVVLVAWLSWRFTRYRVSEHQVELRKGWLFREQRQVPLDRVQAVEIGRPLVAQLLGLAQVVVQSAGGRDSNVTLSYLPLARAHEVRDRIQVAAARLEGSQERYAAGSASAATSLPGDLLGLGPDSGRLVVKVPNGRLVLATLFHGGVVFLALVALVWTVLALTVVPDSWGPFGGFLAAVPGLVPVVFGVVSTRVREVLKHGNFRLTDQGRAVRVLHGLTDHRTATAALQPLPALQLVQPLWWRPMGWWRARVNVAGVHGGGDEITNDTVLLPVGTLDEALRVLTLVDVDLEASDLRTAALGEGGEAGWVTASRSARLFDPLSWRRRGYAVSGHGLLIRSGRLSRRATAVPHARVQSMTVTQGPWERWLDLANVDLVSTPGPIGPRIAHLSTRAAEQLLVEESARTRLARRSEGMPCARGPVSVGLSPVTADLPQEPS